MLLRLAGLTAIAALAIACGDGGKDAPVQTADAATDLNKNNGFDGDAEADQGGNPDTAPADAQPGDTQPGDTAIGDGTTGDTDTQGADGDATTIAPTETDGGSTCPGSAGCACKDAKDCGAKGVCGFDGAGKQVCLAACGSDSSCPAGQTCLKDAAGSACVDQAAVNCAPCKEDKLCGSKGACVSYGAAGNFCGSTCSADADCAAGYACSDSTNIAGTKAKYCKVKDAAGCSCGPLAKQAKASTTCSNGGCTGERSCGAEGLSLCSAASPTDESCDGKDNNCNGQTDESAPCTDKNACTTDTCVAGKCEGAAITCDDKNPCTTDSCDPATGCTAKPDDALACSDGDACTADSCKAGKCSGVAVVCDDKNPCTKDSCAPLSGCATATDDAGTCSDGNPCTKDSCSAGTCKSGDAGCEDGNACTNDACDPAKGCVNLAKAASACDDGDACTKDSCDPKAGCGHAKIAGCLPTIVYTTEFPCGSAQGWSMDPAPLGSSASWAIDGTPKPKIPECSLNFNNGKDFACVNGALSAPASWATSPEINASAYPAWTAFYASFELGGTWSSGQTALMQFSTDGTTWTSLGVLTKSGYDKPTKQSVKIAGAGGKKFKIRFGFNTASCLLTSGTGPYIDGLKIADSACQQNSDCDDNDACSQDSCDLKTGACMHSIATGKCDDDNPCTSGDSCVDGGCEGKPTTGASCDDANVCTSGDACLDGGCTGKPTSKACDDGVACTVNDACNSSGYCNGSSKSCDDGNPCTTDACDPANGVCKSQVLADGAYCSDGDSCTVSDVCIGGKCSSRAKCDDGNPCTDDSCSTSGSCTNAAVTAGTPCTDGDACTSADACAGSTCKGTPAGCKVLWQDDFTSCDGNGWSLDLPAMATWTAWGVDGSALPPGSFSPACSLNFNNGKDFQCAPGQVKVAGVATSPVIDLTTATQATLKYMAWFQTSSDNSTDHRSVQVSADGFKTVLFSVLLSNSGSMSSWQPGVLDLSPVKGKKVQVRFGFDSLHCTTNTGVGWFIDDLKVVVDAVKACSAPNDCNDNNACTDDACTSNKCAYTAKTSGSCDDGNPCTTSDACSAGACKGSNLSCNDSNACTDDSCNPKTGCVSVPELDGGSCGDGDSCTLGDACVAGKCVGPLDKCDDGNPCTKDSCASGGTCTNAKLTDGEACSDGDPCTTADACAAGKCVAKAGPCQVIASDSMECDSQGWVLSKPVSTDAPAWGIDGAPTPGYFSAACSLNFNAATSGFACPSGATSVSGTATSAAKFDLSAAKTASLKFNSYAAVGSATSADLRRIEVSADDFATVPVKHLISNYSGLSSWQALVIDLTPLAGKIVKVRFTFDSVTCESNGGNGWFIDDVQVVGDNGASCAKDADCDDKDPCSADSCVSGKCSYAAASGAECNDNNLCTTKELCASGQCKGGSAVTCNDSNPCTADTCAPAKGCVYTALVDGASCSDGNSCVANDVCKAGNCVGTFTLPEGSSCSDGTVCTAGDTCAGGKCVAKAAAPDGTNCGDGGTPCSIPTVCSTGKCQAKNACDDANPCTVDSCTVVAGAKSCNSAAAPDGTYCDDGDICTASDSCTAGACKGVPACTSQPIAMPCDGAGWTLSAKVGSTAWAFDATPAIPGFVSAPCSLNFNNGINFKESTKTFGEAVSPAVPIGKATLLTLQAYADTEAGSSFDKKFIDVSSDGFATFATYQWTPTSTDMKKWLPVKVNLANYAGKTLQVRLRFDSNDTSLNSGAGWFVDDLALSVPPTQTSASACASNAQCADGNSCTADSCSNGKCSNIAQDKALCDDGSVCTDSSACKGDTCVGGPNKVCDDGDKCTLDSCDAVKGCIATAISGCGEAKMPFTTAFDCGGDLTGWVFQNDAAGPKWQVDGKPADPGFQSPSCSLNFNDDEDFTCPSGADTVQGAVLSPIFDASALAAGTPITVSFGLAGDWESGSFDSLDVTLLPMAGTATAATTTYDAPSGWTTKTIDATKFAGAKFRIKFSFDTTDCAVNGGAGAFIDDLKVSHSGCSKDADCNDGNPCTAETCSSGKCAATTLTGACDDGSACTSGDTCQGTACMGTAKVCDDQSDCTTDSCDKASGACKFATKGAGSFCTDGNPCSYADTCDSAGKCLGQVSADGSTCSDGNACTTKESCSAGVCKSLEIVKDGSSCSDDSPCTTGDACSAGKCVGPTAACNDGNPCTDDSCAKLTTSTFKCDYPAGKDGVSCDDGQPCTQDELCKAGTCKGLDVCKYGLNEAFDGCIIPVGWSADATSTNGTYWGTDAKPTPPGFYSAPCSLNFNDNTNYAGTSGISKGAISSPEVDLTAAKAPTLTFRSYGGMASSLDKRTIEIVEGTTVLQTVTMVYSSTTSDLNKWFAMSVDLKAHIGKKVKVRFRFESDSSNNGGAGWFIDDVKVQLHPAPVVVVVKASDYAFSPDVVTINAGDSVEFQMPSMHAAMEVDQSSWEANDANPIGGGFLVGFGKTAKVKFSKPGTYYYVCPPHVSLGMKGKVVVQ